MLSNTPARKERSMKMELGLRRSQGQGLQVKKSKSNTKTHSTGYVCRLNGFPGTDLSCAGPACCAIR